MNITEYFIRNKIIKESDVYETFVVEGYKEFVLPSSIINIKKFSAYISNSNILDDNTKLPSNNLVLSSTVICKIELELSESKLYVFDFTIPYNKILALDKNMLFKDNIHIENKVLKLLTRTVSENKIYFAILYSAFIHII